MRSLEPRVVGRLSERRDVVLVLQVIQFESATIGV